MNNITKLKVGDSIGIFSPSSPITYTCPNRFERAKKYLQSKEYVGNEKKLKIDIKLQ
jgi:muramoyltetrapeptide carboxypeptidase